MEPILITVSAGDLSEFCFPEGSLGALPSLERMYEGTAAHKKLQNVYAEDESIRYRREVPMEIDYPHGTFTLRLQGRADGLFCDKTDWFIHEIKSTYCAPQSIEKPLKSAHKAQMMFYAYIYAKENALETIKGRLSYFCLPDEQIVNFEYTFTLEALEKFFRAVMEEYAAITEQRLKTLDDLTASAQKLTFPFPSYRQGQREGAAQIYSAIKKEKILFLQAPTGTGKTMMALFPAIKAIGEDPATIFCLSAKNQTKAVTHQALSLLRAQGLKVKSCVITAKAKCCPMDTQNCDPNVCPYSLDFYKKVHDALPELLKTDDYSEEFLKEAARKYEVCPYELSLELALESQVILADYNYLFDPQSYLRRYFDVEGRYLFLIDEAHNLPERGRDMYSAVLTKKDLRETRKLLPKEHRLSKPFARLTTELNKVFKSEAETLTLEDVKKLTFQLMSITEAAQNLPPQEFLPAEVSAYLKDAFRFVALQDYYDGENFVLYTSGDALQLQCLDPGPFLEQSMKKGLASVLYSATLSPYEFYKNSLLPTTEAFGYASPYPFDENRLTVLADYAIDTRYTRREQFFAPIAEKLTWLKQHVSGKMMVFFPSFRFLDAVAEAMAAPDLLLQESDADPSAREDFLAQLAEPGDRMALAVMGSHFAEGIDLNCLTGIVIVGVALPQFNETRQKIREHFEQKLGKGFDYAYVYPGINKVCQAAGRLIRSAEDKGFLLLMDSRFRDYRHLLPAHWHIREVRNTAALQEALKDYEK